MKTSNTAWQASATLLCLCATLAATPAQAFEFSIADVPVKVDNLFTVGAMMRMQKRDVDLIGKSNVTPGLCVSTAARNADGEPILFTGDTCSSSNAAAAQRYLDAPGSFNPNGDNGNLSFEQYDIVSAAAKVTSDINTNIAGFNLFARTLYFFDQRYDSFDLVHPDTTMQPPRTRFSKAGEKSVGHDFRFLDFFASRTFSVYEHDVSVKVGNHVLNWGESSFLLLNSINAINPPDQARLRIPGFDIKELSQPVGMVSMNAQVTDSSSLEAFYQYQWKPILIDPVGSFFSTSDILGAGGTYAMLSFGKAPEDPNQYYSPAANPQDTIGLLGSRSDRTILRDFDEESRRRPDGKGQYGLAFKTFIDELNNGTELAFYYANYHSRIPSVSFFAADETCLSGPSSQVLVNFATCRAAGGEPIPVGSVRLFAEYPKDVHMLGTSFNTNVGDWALSGEFVYRPNLPLQIHPADLIFAALQPAFPTQDVNLGVATIPGRRSAVPDFVETNYRGHTVTAGQYIRGYERMKVGQLGSTAIKTIGGDNWLNATQITLLLEGGWTHVFGMPSLSELQFNGAEVNTHISAGADGSAGINPRDVRSDPADAGSNVSDPSNRQNPTAQRRKGYGTANSAGYRAVATTRYDSLFYGINMELLTAAFHDVIGVGPGLGQNFVEGRLQLIGGVRFDYLSTVSMDLRYTYIADSRLDAQRDRDNLLVFFGYQF